MAVDASQGIEAQTLANVYLAMEQDLEIIGIVNKIDLPGADPDRVKAEMENVLGIPGEEIIPISAKNRLGRGRRCWKPLYRASPARAAMPRPPLAGLNIRLPTSIPIKGAISYIRVVSGQIRRGDMIKMMSNGKVFETAALGVISPYMTEVESLSAGEVGYLAAGIKNVSDTRVGDTITPWPPGRPTAPCRAIRWWKPMVSLRLISAGKQRFRETGGCPG